LITNEVRGILIEIARQEQNQPPKCLNQRKASQRLPQQWKQRATRAYGRWRR
jgi:hypothetical protein